MKITESRIRQYIRQLLAETLYGGVDGAPTQTRGQFEKQPGNRKIIDQIPADVAPVDRSFPAKLAKYAKKEFESMQQNDPETFDMIKQKALPVAFGYTYDELLDNLTFTQSDLKYINMDIKSTIYNNRENYEQSMALLDALMPKTAAYLRHITSATDDFSRDESGAKYTTLNPDMTAAMGPVFGRDHFTLFFQPPDNPGDKGMGQSLIDLIFEKIMSAIVSIRSKTPVEFAEQLYPEFEAYVNTMFEKNPIIANNVKYSAEFGLKLDKVRKGYLDSIRYVLIELIAELNFEFLYFGNGMEIKSNDPNQLLLFLPDDISLLKHVSAVAASMEATNSGWGQFNWNLGDVFRPDSFLRSDIPELRSMPSYYDIKFSVNPNFASIIGGEAKAEYKSRMYDNLMFAVGFENEGVEYPDSLHWGGISELWEKS